MANKVDQKKKKKWSLDSTSWHLWSIEKKQYTQKCLTDILISLAELGTFILHPLKSRFHTSLIFYKACVYHAWLFQNAVTSVEFMAVSILFTVKCFKWTDTAIIQTWVIRKQTEATCRRNGHKVSEQKLFSWLTIHLLNTNPHFHYDFMCFLKTSMPLLCNLFSRSSLIWQLLGF